LINLWTAPWSLPGGPDLKKFTAIALAGFCCIAAFASARAADQVASSTILSPADVKTYGEIFAAQKTGQFAKADRLIAKLQDTSLLGIAISARTIGPNSANSNPG
jgi:hypothetical protein